MVTIAEIIDAAAQALGVSAESIIAYGRSKTVARARTIAMYLAREQTAHSWAEIGAVFQRDHSTIIAAHSYALANWADLRRDVGKVKSALSA